MSYVFLVLLAILVGLLSVIYFTVKSQLNYWQKRGVPCEQPHFMFGNVYGMMTTRSFHDISYHYYRKFKGSGLYAGFYMFQKPSVFVLEPHLAKLILIKDFSNFTDRGFYSNTKDDPLSGHLFILDGHKWRTMRSKLTATFTSGKMRYMFPTVMNVGREFVEVFNEAVEANKIIEVKEWLARYTTDVIGTCAFGIECSSLRDPNAQFRIMGRKALTDLRHGRFGMIMVNAFPKLALKLRMKVTPEHIEEFFMRIVRETVNYRETHNIRRNDFMDLLIDLKNNKLLKSEHGDAMNLTLEEIAAQASLFFNAGFETSSTTMGFVLYELAQHEDIQQRVRDELNAALEQSEQREFSYDIMNQLNYLDQVIYETMRLYTVLPNINRKALNDYVIPDHPELTIEKDTFIIIPAAAFHRDPTLYPNPEVFNPDNFSPENVKARDTIEYLAFGDGPRNCIGLRFGMMQTRVGLALLLTHFKFTVCDQTEIPCKYDKQSFLIKTLGGINLKVEKV